VQGLNSPTCSSLPQQVTDCAIVLHWSCDGAMLIDVSKNIFHLWTSPYRVEDLYLPLTLSASHFSYLYICLSVLFRVLSWTKIHILALIAYSISQTIMLLAKNLQKNECKYSILSLVSSDLLPKYFIERETFKVSFNILNRW